MPKRRIAREAAQAAVDGAAATAQPGQDQPPEGTRSIVIQLSPETWEALQRLADNQEQTLQSITSEAISDYLRRRSNGSGPE